jgi:hypothetical protein
MNVFTWHPLSPLQAWRLAHFDIVANTNDAADAADPDGDGLRNLAEYATGRDPRASGAAGVGAGATGVRFPRNLEATDVDFLVDAASELPATNWITIARKSGSAAWVADPGVSVADSGTGTVAIAEAGSYTQRFWRVQISRP